MGASLCLGSVLRICHPIAMKAILVLCFVAAAYAAPEAEAEPFFFGLFGGSKCDCRNYYTKGCKQQTDQQCHYEEKSVCHQIYVEECERIPQKKCETHYKRFAMTSKSNVVTLNTKSNVTTKRSKFARPPTLKNASLLTITRRSVPRFLMKAATTSMCPSAKTCPRKSANTTLHPNATKCLRKSAENTKSRNAVKCPTLSADK